MAIAEGSPKREALAPMPKELRFAVGTSEDVRSTIWRLWAHKDELYLAGRSVAGMLKISFHKSGVCRIATNSREPRAPLAKWERPRRGGPGTISLFGIFVPTLTTRSAFREHIPPPQKALQLIAPSPVGKKTYINILSTEPMCDPAVFTIDPPDTPFSIVGCVHLKSETVWVIAYENDFTQAEEKIALKMLGEVGAFKVDVGSVKSAFLHSFQRGTPPCITDLQLGPEHVNLR